MPEVYGLDPGARFAGKYRVEHVLGRGGMGCVFAARREDDGRRVAIKCLWPNVTSEETRKRFNREVRLVQKLRSPNVVRVLEAGLVDGVGPYMVMEHLDGANLKELFAGRPAAVAEAVSLVRQAIDAVAEAHALGIVHRDLKPANIFVTRSAEGAPFAKVLDFGISKAADSVALTKDDSTLGSPPYMPPEQFSSSNEVDARADIWALGVILYELLTGISPFEADSLPRVCFRVLGEEPPPPSTVASGVPAALDAVVMQCLRKEREDRFPSCEALARALEPFAPAGAAFPMTRTLLDTMPARAAPSLAAVSNTGARLEATPVRARRARWGIVAAAAVVVLVVASAGARQLLATSGRAARATAEAAVPSSAVPLGPAAVDSPSSPMQVASAPPSAPPSALPSALPTALPSASPAPSEARARAAPVATGAAARRPAPGPTPASLPAPAPAPAARGRSRPSGADGDLDRRF